MTPEKKRSGLQFLMKLTSSPNELSFDAHRSLYTQKPSLHAQNASWAIFHYPHR